MVRVDAEIGPAVFLNHVVRGFDVKLMHLRGRFLQQADFDLIEFISRALVPVGRLRIIMMPREALTADGGFPIRAGRQAVADHERPEKKPPVRPNPPRRDAWVEWNWLFALATALRLGTEDVKLRAVSGLECQPPP